MSENQKIAQLEAEIEWLRGIIDDGLRIHGEQCIKIERLRGLLDDKDYIRIKADYNNGHLSHAGWLDARERATSMRADNAELLSTGLEVEAERDIARFEIERLQADVTLWKERWESERRDHEAAINHANKMMQGEP